MSTEKNAGVMEPAKKTYKSTYINREAYLPFIQEYCEEKVKQGVFKRVDSDHVIGKFRGMTYEIPNGHWVQLNYAPGSRSGKANAFYDINPETKRPVLDEKGNPLGGDIFTLIATVKGVNRWSHCGWRDCRKEALDILGEYPGRQVLTYDNKLDKQAIQNDPAKDYLSKAQVNEDKRVRDEIIAQMDAKMITEIDRSGTLFGNEPVKMPVVISSNTIAFWANGKKWDKKEYDGEVPDYSYIGLDELHQKKDYKGDLHRSLVGQQMKGLLYVAAMQDGKPDKRYMELDDLLNGTRSMSNGVKVRVRGEGMQKRSPNYVYHKDFGFRNLIGTPAPEVDSQIKEWDNEKTGRHYKRIIYSLKDPDKAEKNGQIINTAWVDHSKWSHLVQKSYVNVDQIGLRPLDYSPNEHSADKSITTIRPAPVQNKETMLKGVAEKALKLYGISIRDRGAFKKDPVGEMRKIIYMGTKLEGGQQTVGNVGTENDKIFVYGMRAFQRELTLDYIMRTCGYRGGIEIPKRDRNVIKGWLQGDMVNTKQPHGQRLIDATVAMDKNNLKLRGMSKEEKQFQNQQIQEREKFTDLSMAFLSDYTMNDGTKLQKGTGMAEWSKPIAKTDAYEILSDICYQDKVLYNNPDKKVDRKEVHFNLTIGGETYKDVTLTLGNLEMGNEPTVADSLMNLLLKRERENAFSRDAINKNFKELDDARQNKFVKEDFAKVTKEELAGKAKADFDEAYDKLAASLMMFKEDEAAYKQTLAIEGKTMAYDNAKLEADVYRYEVPTKDTTLMYEVYGTQNIVGIREPKQRTGAEVYKESMIVELRKPLEPLKDEQNNNINSTMTDSKEEIPVFGDITTRRDRPTRTIEAVPFRKEHEWTEHTRMLNSFSVEYQASPENKPQVFRGTKGRDKLLLISMVDKLSFDEEKAGYRSIANVVPVKVTVKWDNTVLFEKEGRIGSKAFSNYHSVEELMSSQRDSLNENSKKALDLMLKCDHEQMKYSKNHDMNTAMLKNEILEQKEIDEILKTPKRVAEYRDEANREGVSRVDRLETEAVLNFKEEDQKVMDHIVDRMAGEAKTRNPAELKAITEEIRQARPEMEEFLKKSIKRKSIQRRFNGRPFGIKRKTASEDLQR